jgi:hypothetical protein
MKLIKIKSIPDCKENLSFCLTNRHGMKAYNKGVWTECEWSSLRTGSFTYQQLYVPAFLRTGSFNPEEKLLVPIR